MADQAEKLRELVQEKEHEVRTEEKNIVHLPLTSVSFRQRTIAITSGKGGVGKTNFVANLSIALAQLKKEVLILDADLGLANLDIIMGLAPNQQRTLHQVVMGKKELHEVLITGPEGVKIIPGATGIQELADLNFDMREEFLRKLSDMETRFDAFLIDTGAGLSQNVLSFCLAASEVIVVTTPEPTAYMDAYGVIKVLSKENPEIHIRLVINMVSSEEEGQQVFEKISEACRNFLQISIEKGGYLIKDRSVTKAVLAKKPFIMLFPECEASRCIRDIASRLYELKNMQPQSRGLKGFFRRFVYSVRSSSSSMAPMKS